jgi:hypothetical protein
LFEGLKPDMNLYASNENTDITKAEYKHIIIIDMKNKIKRKYIVLISCLSIIMSIQSQNTIGPFTFYPTKYGGFVLGKVTVNGIPASDGDIVVAYNQDGECVGASEIIINNNDSFTNLLVYGEDGFSAGIIPGENFFLKLYKISSGQIIEYGAALSGWENTNFTPIQGYDDPSQIFDFIDIPCEDATANAGEDVVICENDIVQLSGVAENYTNIIWQTTGDGYFEDSTNLLTNYIPGIEDIVNGNVDLCLTAFAEEPCNDTTTCLSLTIFPSPMAFAGSDLTSCGTETVTLEGDAISYEYVEWSGGVGTFSNPNELVTNYTPDPSEIGSQITLCLEAISAPFCTTSSIDCMELNISNCGAPSIINIYDVPGDQGGWVYIDFFKSIYDTDTLRNIEIYTVERYDIDKWVSINSILAYGLDEYTILAPTLNDSSQFYTDESVFRILAGMDEGNWASEPASGYSVDNLAPFAPENLTGYMTSDQLHLNWSEPLDDDFQYFAIFKSDENGQFNEEPIVATTNNYIDIDYDQFDYSYRVTAFDLNGNESEESNIVHSQNIEIGSGWAGLSSYIIPDYPTMETILEPISEKLIILHSMDGIYWPGENLNTISNWDELDGYYLKVTENIILPLIGKFPDDKNLLIQDGWSIIPVRSPCEVNIAELFIGSNLEIVKEVAGYNLYWPDYGINTLGALEPGKAYFVLMNEETEITFPECDGMKTSTIKKNTFLVPGEYKLTKTPNNHVIAFEDDVFDKIDNAYGNYIIARNTFGEICGVLVWENKGAAITIFGDDALTSQPEGMEEGEDISLFMMNQETNEEIPVSPTWDVSLPQHDGKFATNGISAIKGLSLTGTDDLLNYGDQILVFPNPARDEINVIIPEVGLCKVNILDIKGREIYQRTTTQSENIFDVSSLEKGIYLIEVTSESFSRTIKFVKE